VFCSGIYFSHNLRKFENAHVKNIYFFCILNQNVNDYHNNLKICPSYWCWSVCLKKNKMLISYFLSLFIVGGVVHEKGLLPQPCKWKYLVLLSQYCICMEIHDVVYYKWDTPMLWVIMVHLPFDSLKHWSLYCNIMPVFCWRWNSSK